MRMRLRRMLDDDSGFSLVEIVVVVIIIGMLAAIAIPVFLNQRKKSAAAAMKTDLRSVALEMETYFINNRVYPAVTSASGTVNVGGTSVRLSRGNTIGSSTTGAATGTFCLRATNTTVAAGVWYVYDSDKGGLRRASACT